MVGPVDELDFVARLQFALDGVADPWVEPEKAQVDIRQFEALPL